MDTDAWNIVRPRLGDGEELLWAGHRHLPGSLLFVGLLLGAACLFTIRHPDALSPYGITRAMLFRSGGRGSLESNLLAASILITVGALTQRLWVFGLTNRRLMIIAPRWAWFFLSPVSRGAGSSPQNGMCSLFLVRSGPPALHKGRVQIGPVSAWVDDPDTLYTLATAARQKVLDEEERIEIESFKH